MVARLLKEQGEEVVVLEKDGSIGGLCRSVSTQGFTFDTGGSHIIFSRDQEVLSLIHSLLGPNQSSRNRDTRVLYKGRYIQYPFENGLAGLPKEDLFLCLNEYIRMLCWAAAGRVPPPANFREWMVATFGQGIADCYLIPYNEKIWNCPPEQMSAHWVMDRVPRPPPEDIIRSAIGIRTEGYSHQAVFSYPVRGGIESLIHEIARPISGQVRTGFTVREVRLEDDGYCISDGQETVVADRVISSIPLQALIPAMQDVPHRVTDALSALRYTSLTTVSVGIRGRVPPFSWVYIPDRDTGLPNRISFPSNYSTEVAPPGCSSVLAEITWNQGDEVSRMDDHALGSHVTGMLTRLGITKEEDVVYTRVDRTPFAYVVYTLEYPDAIRIVREFCHDRGIILAGRFAQFEYLNMDGCIRAAIETVRGLP